MSSSQVGLDEVAQRLRKFVDDREWSRFHTPKNLAVSLSVEAGELLEHFQWLESGEENELGEAHAIKVRHELADVLICAIRLADRLGIDPIAAVLEKIEINEIKYPAQIVRGSAKKYTEY